MARMVSMDRWIQARWRALLGAVAAGVVLLVVLWGAVEVYTDHLIEDARQELLASLHPQSRALAVAVDRRISLLSALRAFVVVDPSAERLSDEFQTFAGELGGCVSGVRNLTLAPGGVQTYVYPCAGNQPLIGHDLATDARPEVREQYTKAVSSGAIALSGPHEWRDGGMGLIAHLAIDVDDTTWGVATLSVDLVPLLSDAGLDRLWSGVRFVLVDDTGHAFSGDTSVLADHPVSLPIELADTEWMLAVAPEVGWQSAVSGSLQAVWVSGVLLVLAVAGQVYSLVHRERRIVDTAAELARSAAEGHARLLSSAARQDDQWHEILTTAGVDAARIAITYLVVGVLWIALSDTILAQLGLSPAAITRAQSLKGSAFVAASALLVFIVVRRRLVQIRRSAGLAAASEVRYRLLAENTLDVIWQVDADGCLTYVNPGSQGLLGYAPADLVGTTIDTLAEGEDLAHLQQQMAGALGTGVSGEITGHLRHRDGSRIPVEIRANVICDDDGAAIGLQGFARDIRDLVAAERERGQLLARVRNQAVLVERIIHTVPDGVVLLDEACRPTLVNPAAERLLRRLNPQSGVEGEVLTHLGSRPLSEVLKVPPEGLWHEILVGDEAFEVVARHLVDPQLPEEVSSGRWVLLLHDATSERESRARLEEQARLSALGQMAAGIAHDFNNILAVVMLYTQMALRGDGLETVTRERLQVVLEQSERAGALVQQILDFGRRSAIALELTDVAHLVAEEVELLKRTLPESIEVVFAQTGGPCVVRADRRRLQQAMMNLAVNARDAMPDGGVFRVTVSRLHVASGSTAPLPNMQAGHYVQILAEDSGNGIPRDIVPHIFEPFFTTKQAGKGSGLGLAQVYGIVQQHNGQIGVKSDPGKGTRFTICLPSAEESGAKDELGGLTTAPRGTGDLVLLVEDHAATRVAVAESLEVLNYQVVTASHGGEALAILDRPAHGVGVVLSDFVMPQVDGRALFLALRERGMPVPMVILTGHPLTDELEEMRTEGLSGWLSKPPDLAKLAGLLARALGR